MSDKGLLSEDRIKTIAQRIIWNAPGEYDEKEWLEYEKLVVEIIGGVVAEAGEEAAKIAENMNNALAQAQVPNMSHTDWVRMQMGAPQLSAEQRIAAAIRRRVGR